METARNGVEGLRKTFELAPDLCLPDTGEPLQVIVSAMRGEGMEALCEMTDRLRERLRG